MGRAITSFAQSLMNSPTRKFCWLAFALFCACAWSFQAAAAGPKQVVLLLSDATALYQATAQAIRAELEAESGKVALRNVVLGEATADNLVASADTLIVAIGLRAAQFAAKFDAPILAVLIARQSYESLAAASSGTRRRPLSAVYLDQPPARHFNLIRSALPRVQSIGFLFGPAQAAMQSEWSSAAKGAGFTFVPVVVSNSNELFSVLQASLPGVDALMLLPDPMVVNRGSVQSLMLSTYRQRVPVIGYSQALVEAGALLAVYSTPQQIGQQTGEIIARTLPGRTWELPAATHPKYFMVKSNGSVSRALELAVPSDPTLLQRLGGGS